MISCRKASELSSQAMDRRLTLSERVSLWIHLRICKACALFTTQLQTIRKAIKADVAGEFGCAKRSLTEEAKRRICERVEEEVS